jgi:hypothetical protein
MIAMLAVRLTLFLPVIYRDGCGGVHVLIQRLIGVDSLLFPCSALLFGKFSAFALISLQIWFLTAPIYRNLQGRTIWAAPLG